MAAKVKPVQPTEIKDKKIIREVIAQVRRKPIFNQFYTSHSLISRRFLKPLRINCQILEALFHNPKKQMLYQYNLIQKNLIHLQDL